jgi:PAS domain S-box-containing protein
MIGMSPKGWSPSGAKKKVHNMTKKKIAEIDKIKTGSQYLSDLRRKAEEKFKAADAQAAKKLTPEEIQQTLHELQVHQIELQMQNEELLRVQFELENARANYFDLYDLAPVGYVTICEQGLLLETNLTATLLLGVSRGALAGQPFSRFIIKEDHDIYYLYRKQLFEIGAAKTCELRMLNNEGNYFWAQLDVTVKKSEDGDSSVYRVVLSDISGRKQAEDAQNRLIAELENAQVKVKTLIGLLPICAGCKKIRDDQGNWGQLELYIQSHSEAKFTHSMCPKCMKNYCPKPDEGESKE